MAGELRGKRIAAVVEQGFEQVELTEPRKALEAAGATVEVVSHNPARSRVGSTRNGAMRYGSIGRWPKLVRMTTTRCCCRAA